MVEYPSPNAARRRAGFQTLDSGTRATYDSGMVRDTQEGKARFDLLTPEGVPYPDQFLTRVAQLMTRGIAKYGERNWEKADSQAEVDRFESSAFRHLMQWFSGETDEDHSAAVVFNLLAAETTRFKMGRAEASKVVMSGPPSDQDIYLWIRANPSMFDNWVSRRVRTHGRMPGV